MLGIFGTVIGFYFGSFEKAATTPADALTIQSLGGVLVGDAAYFREGTISDDDLAKIATVHPLRRIYLDQSKVTNAGLATHLVKLDNLTFLSVRQTKVDKAGAEALEKSFKDKKKDLRVDYLPVATP